MFYFSNAIHQFLWLIGKSLQTQPPDHTKNDKFVVARRCDEDNNNVNMPSILIEIIEEMDHFLEIIDAIEAKTHEIMDQDVDLNAAAINPQHPYRSGR